MTVDDIINLILNFWYLLAAVCTVILFVLWCRPKIVTSQETSRHYHYSENCLISINEYAVDWGHRICLQIFNLKLVYPTQKKIKLLSISPKSTLKISKKSHSALKTKLEKKFRKCVEKPDIKDLLLFSDADYGPCPRFWQEISNSDYVVEITTPVDEEIRRQVTCERNGNNLVITNNTSEIVCSYPCPIPSGYNIRDLEPLKKYIQSSSSESEGSPVSLILQNIESRPDENKITISIVLAPPEQPIVPDSPATQVSTER